MATISSPAACLALVAALLLSGVGVSLPIDSAHADDHCVTAPGTAAPNGQHWYYSLDRAKHRKCWYLHATMRLPPRATNAASAPQPAADTSNPTRETASAPPAPRVTVLAVRTVDAPLVSVTSALQAAAPELTGEPPMPQIAASDADVPMEESAKSARRADPATVPLGPDTARNGSPSADTAPSAPVRTPPALPFFLLATALAIAAGLIALFGNTVTRARRPRLSDHPDDAWRRYHRARQRADEVVTHAEDAPLLASHEPRERADLGAHDWIEESPPAQADLPAARPQMLRQMRRGIT